MAARVRAPNLTAAGTGGTGTAGAGAAAALRRLLARADGPPSTAALAEALRPAGPAGRAGGVPVDGPLGSLLPDGRLPVGAVVGVTGAPGTGHTSVALELLAAATRAGSWAAVVDVTGVIGGRAASEAGVDLGHVAVVRGVDAARWPTVVAALLDGVALVVAEPPAVLPLADARRLAARARERRATLVALGDWPERPALQLRAVSSTWYGLDDGEGLLAHRLLTVEGDDRTGRTRRVDLVGPAPAGGGPCRETAPATLTDAPGDAPAAVPLAG